MLIFFAIVFGLYTLMVIALAWGWTSLGERTSGAASAQRTIAVVVAFRNEAETLPQLIDDLKRIDYPADLLEFILVDDDSHDTSLEIASTHIAGDPRFRLLSTGIRAAGKKNAITVAIASAKATIVAVTDADCRLPAAWLKIINATFDNGKTKMAVGPVRLWGTGASGSLQSMEFASLVGTTGATIAFGIPTMANAANLAFLRSAFLEVKGYEGNESISSGDDQFLLNKFIDAWNDGVVFLHHQGAVVTAGAASDVRTFVEQRLRWAGKWKLAMETSAWLALAILCFHICNLWLIGAWLHGLVPTNAFAAFTAAKVFAEVIFLFPVCRFLGVKWSWTSFLILQLFYSLYVIAIGFLSQILTARWKGREVTTRVWTGIA